MIVRIVQMTFRPDAVDTFLQLFDGRKHLIRGFEGCRHLELWQDAHNTNIFFTYSMWDSEEHLNHYRFSPLFKDVWSHTKPLFSAKAQAWSVNQKVVVGK
ncbi:MAG: antibiotic biosynthesis monooxygenase family protein [Bacteroidota bacterium]